ncbi:hypothetical protein VVR12_06410 [Rothia sp. LK2588]|uniref:hypothetical protein n=1 Tax=Rothia sp. LK2588 TaxID=3114369 RepID=UPI0034CDCFDF
MERKYSRKVMVCAALVASSFMITPLAGANPLNPSASTTSPSSYNEISSFSQMTVSDWREIERRARVAGDIPSADLASYFANGKHRETSSNYGVAGWIKNAVKITLKYYKDRLPASIRPHADKLYNVLNRLDEWTEGSIATGLIQLGMDPVTAQTTAHHMSLFISTFGPI